MERVMKILKNALIMLKGLVFAGVVLLSACGQQFGGDGERSLTLNEKGREIYNGQCASCHGPSGEGGSGGGLIACATCGSHESLIAKIERDMPSASDPLHGENASDVAEYIIAAFNESGGGQVQRSLPGVATMTPNEAVYKLAFELAGRLPTQDEVELFGSNLEGERAVVFGFMETDYFYERLKDMFNDTLLTDARRDENQPGSAGLTDIDSLYSNTFRKRDENNDQYTVLPDLNWESDYNDDNGNMLSDNYLRYFSREALARKPLLLVEYIARNDRDFREFISGKYTVANRFSYEAFSNGEFGSNLKVVDPDQAASNGALPFATNVQWKTWENQQELLDYLDVVALYNNPASGNDLSQNYILNEFAYDPRDIKPVQMYYNNSDGRPQNTGVPHSGIITDEIFLNKYTATETNMHRNRARMIYWFFAGKDLLAIEGNREAADLEFEDFDNVVGVDDPTATNPDCIVCHEVMDPVAKAFENYNLSGLYDTDNVDEVDSHDDAIGWGLSKSQIQSSGANGYNNRELQWLGEQIASDAAYPKGIAQIVVRGMTGQDILGQPGLESPAEYESAYVAQAKLITTAAGEFVESGYNIKDLIYAVTKSAYYRSTGVLVEQMKDEYSQLGSVRYLPAQLVNQKLRALNSGGWSNSLNLYQLNSRMFMGAKNSNDVLEDSDSVSGIISAVTERLAVEESCDIVRNEFNMDKSERSLFDVVDDNVNLDASTAAARSAQAKAIRLQITKLYLAALYQEVSSDSEEVDVVFELFSNVLNGSVNSSCNTGGSGAGVAGSSLSVREAWYAVMVYILTDYRFIYS
jgi:hypothetical protein